jgi:hypothetical protein
MTPVIRQGMAGGEMGLPGAPLMLTMGQPSMGMGMDPYHQVLISNVHALVLAPQATTQLTWA